MSGHVERLRRAFSLCSLLAIACSRADAGDAPSTLTQLAEFDLEGELVWGTTWGGRESDAGFALYPTDDGWLLAFYTSTALQLGTPAVGLPVGEHLMWVRPTSVE